MSQASYGHPDIGRLDKYPGRPLARKGDQGFTFPLSPLRILCTSTIFGLGAAPTSGTWPGSL